MAEDSFSFEITRWLALHTIGLHLSQCYVNSLVQGLPAACTGSTACSGMQHSSQPLNVAATVSCFFTGDHWVALFKQQVQRQGNLNNVPISVAASISVAAVTNTRV